MWSHLYQLSSAMGAAQIMGLYLSEGGILPRHDAQLCVIGLGTQTLHFPPRNYWHCLRLQWWRNSDDINIDVNSQATCSRTRLALMWTDPFGIHANSNSYSYWNSDSWQCERYCKCFCCKCVCNWVCWSLPKVIDSCHAGAALYSCCFVCYHIHNSLLLLLSVSSAENQSFLLVGCVIL